MGSLCKSKFFNTYQSSNLQAPSHLQTRTNSNMTPLVQNIAWKDAKWSKFKRDYMWNNVYYLRRSKFIVYQLATIFIGVGHVISDFTLKRK